MLTSIRSIADDIGRKPAHAGEGSGAITAYSPVAVRGAIGLRSFFSFVSFLLEQQKKRKHTMSENNNKTQQMTSYYPDSKLIILKLKHEKAQQKTTIGILKLKP